MFTRRRGCCLIGVDPPKELLELEEAHNNLQSSDSVPREKCREEVQSWNDHNKPNPSSRGQTAQFVKRGTL
eukprot:123288-Amphidinium_carterae.3